MEVKLIKEVKPIINRLTELKEGEAGLYALVIGVSSYPNLPKETLLNSPDDEPPGPPDFGMRPLTSSSLAAYKVFKWLNEHRDNLDVQLATCHLLLSPSKEELKVEPEMRRLAPQATKDNLMKAAKQWREYSGKNRRNITFFYFAGHGVERRPKDHILLMEDFGDGIGHPLRHGVATQHIFNGMAPFGEFNNIARTQFYFVDACRTTPEPFKSLVLDDVGGDLLTLYTAQEEQIDNRICPIFYATTSGEAAYSIKKDQTLFSKALLSCLNGDAGVREGRLNEDFEYDWCITSRSLNEGLEICLRKVDTERTNQKLVTDGLGTTVILSHLTSPPEVGVSLRVIPGKARNITNLDILDDKGELFERINKPVDPHPHSIVLPAGYYQILANIEPPTKPYRNFGPRICSAFPTKEIEKEWFIPVGPRQK